MPVKSEPDEKATTADTSVKTFAVIRPQLGIQDGSPPKMKLQKKTQKSQSPHFKQKFKFSNHNVLRSVYEEDIQESSPGLVDMHEVMSSQSKSSSQRLTQKALYHAVTHNFKSVSHLAHASVDNSDEEPASATDLKLQGTNSNRRLVFSKWQSPVFATSRNIILTKPVDKPTESPARVSEKAELNSQLDDI